jgi:hypothetical protein
VLKRLLGLAAKTESSVKPNAIEDMIKLRPSVRENVYAFVRSKDLTPSLAGALANAIESGLFVDDASSVDMANNLVETFVKNKRCHSELERIIANTDPNNYFGLYSRLWLQSKYCTPTEIYQTLADYRDTWASDEQMGRLAASFIPLFRGAPEEGPFRNLLAEVINPGVRQVSVFHSRMTKDASAFNEMFKILRAQNTSRKTGITHAKFLCLLSALRNSLASSAQINTLKTNHARAFSDAYYKSIARRLGL